MAYTERERLKKSALSDTKSVLPSCIPHIGTVVLLFATGKRLTLWPIPFALASNSRGHETSALHIQFLVMFRQFLLLKAIASKSHEIYCCPGLFVSPPDYMYIGYSSRIV